ncbi:MAG TPA: SUF system NifU family Fe-S cluster assembly protein [Candidatus Limnocylindrales bacterium]|nr:SUF system NifU family Fe-S cluster assembly protein [Candidatus Limnocylindrales bacterium]
MSLDDFYRQDILDHSQNPRNFGTLDHPDLSAEDSNPLCGDRIRIDIRVKDGAIEDVRFTGVGCSISRAAASMLTEEIKGKTLEEVKRIGRDEVLEMLGIELGPVRLKCALLALKTLKVGVYGLQSWQAEEDE